MPTLYEMGLQRVFGATTQPAALVRSRRLEHRNDVRTAVVAGSLERRLSRLIARVRIGAMREQQSHQVGAPLHDGEQQWRAPQSVRLTTVRALIQQRSGAAAVACGDGGPERGVALEARAALSRRSAGSGGRGIGGSIGRGIGCGIGRAGSGRDDLPLRCRALRQRRGKTLGRR